MAPGSSHFPRGEIVINGINNTVAREGHARNETSGFTHTYVSQNTGASQTQSAYTSLPGVQPLYERGADENGLHAYPVMAGQELRMGLTPAPQHDTVARFLAYTSPYLFWCMLSVLSCGIVLIR